MGYRIEDGKGSRSRTAVFENRTRTLSTVTSLMNHISSAVSEPGMHPTITGIFESIALSSVAGSGGSLIYLVNNDPVNFVIIDRIITNTFISSATLPNASTFIQVLMSSTFTPGTGIPIIVDNTNQSIVNVQPNATILHGATTSGGVELSRRYVNISRVYFQEPIIQKSDGIILGKGNSIELFLSTNASTSIEVNMRFAVADPDNLEF